MKDIHYEFADLDNDEYFELVAKCFRGTARNNILHFDNDIAKGTLIKAAPDKGLWLRKWKFITFQKIVLHKLPALEINEKKFILIYFLNPAIFFLTSNFKRINVHGCRNNIFLTSEAMIDIRVMPKQSFYVLEIAFSLSWLLDQFYDAEPSLKTILDQYLNKNTRAILTELCTIEEYKTLRELEVADSEDSLFMRSRAYNLVFNFLSKIINREAIIQGSLHYEQIMQAQMMIMENVQQFPGIESIARKVNMSISSLLRQFKLIHGKSIYGFYVAKKMELAKKMILENEITISELSDRLGYKQSSAFIESFTKHWGYGPGSLKHARNEFLVTE